MRAIAIFPLMLLVTACSAAPPTGLVIEGVLTADDATCTVDVTGPLRVEGVLDTSALAAGARTDGMAYVLALRVANYEDLRCHGACIAVPDRWVANHAEIELQRDGARLDLGGMPNPYFVPADGAVGSAYGTEPGTGIAAANVLPEEVVAQLVASGVSEVEISIRVVGLNIAGVMRTSTTAVYPIRLCAGCLLTCAATGSEPRPGCLVGQDEPGTVACD